MCKTRQLESIYKAASLTDLSDKGQPHLVTTPVLMKQIYEPDITGLKMVVIALTYNQ